MADFLKLNNIPIPVADGSMRFGFEEQGSRARAMDGSLRSTRTTLKRTWRCKTPILDPETALMVAGLLTGSGHSFRFDVDAFDLKGYGPIDPAGAGVYALRTGVTPESPQPAEYGLKYGGAVAVEDGTANLFSQNVRTGTDSGANTTGFTAVDGATLLSQDLPALAIGIVALQGDRVLDVSVVAGAGGVRGGVKTNAIVVAAATAYTASVFVQATAAVRCQLKDVVNGVNGTVQSVSPQSIGCDLGDAKWVRISSTVTTGGGVPQLEFEVLEDTADTAPQFYCDEFQLEAKAGPTSWFDGTRGVGLLKMDVQSFESTGRVIAEGLRTAIDMTAMLWINRADDRFEGQRAIWWFAQNPISPTEQPFYGHYLGLETLMVGNAISYEVEAGGLDAPTPSATTPVGWTSTLALNTWAHVAVVVRRNGKYGADANTLKLYVDGVLRDESLMTGANESLPDFSKIKAFYLGTSGGSTGSPRRFTGGLMDDLVVVPYAMTAAGIAAVAAAGRAFSDLPRLEVEGDAIVSPPFRPIVLAELPNGEYTQAHLSAVWVQNLRTVEILLQEV